MTLRIDRNLVCEVCGSFVEHEAGVFNGRVERHFSCSNPSCSHYAEPDAQVENDTVPSWVVFKNSYKGIEA
jgi:hypothetical protein